MNSDGHDRVAEAFARIMAARYPGTSWTPATTDERRPVVRLANPTNDHPRADGGMSVDRAA
jgi:hypothetical protein